jgi:hypothetical protein
MVDYGTDKAAQVAPGEREHPAGRLVVSTAQNKAGLSRQTKAGTAFRVAPGVYIVGATLPLEHAIRHHRTGIISVFWPGGVLCDRTALAGGGPVDGWVFVAHPDPPRQSDLVLPGVTVSPRRGPGPLPGDMPMPDGLYLSGPARKLVENVSAAGRPPVGRPARQAGTTEVVDVAVIPQPEVHVIPHRTPECNLVDGDSLRSATGGEEAVELSRQVVGRGPTELCGDDDGLVAAA